MAAASIPIDLHPLPRGEARHRAQHREAVVALGVDRAALQAARCRHGEAVVRGLDLGAEPAQAVDDGGDAVGLLEAQLVRRPRTTVSPSAKQPSRATSGSSSIASGTSSRLDLGGDERGGATSRSPTGSSAGIVVRPPRGRPARSRAHALARSGGSPCGSS